MFSYDPLKPMREAMSNIDSARIEAIRLQTVDIPKMINSKSLTAQLQPDWDAIYSAMKIDSQSINNALTVKLELIDFTQTYKNSMHDILSNIRKLSSFKQIDFSYLFKNTRSFSSSYFEDFRKNVIVNEVFKELDDYQEETVSITEFHKLKTEMFEMSLKVTELKQSNLQMGFDTDINSMRVDTLERKYTVHILLGWLISILQLYGVSLDYETTKYIFESFVQIIKYTIEQVNQ